jgi:citrate synthase
MILKEKLAEIIPQKREEMKSLMKNYSSTVISDVTVDQLFGGMRGVKSIVCDTSEVVVDKGLMIRGIPILDLIEKTPEEVFYLLLTGELPDAEALDDLTQELHRRSEVPFYVWDVLNALPSETHPMVMLSTAVLIMENESYFKKRYEEGLSKDRLWEPMFLDSLNLIARMPAIAAYIYRKKFNKGPRIREDNRLDWATNFAKMLGIKDPDGSFAKLMRLYMVLHSDHEGGNVSSFASSTIGSSMSDLYYMVAGALNGLAGPLHGLANQECLRFIMKLRDDIGHPPTDEEVKNYCEGLLNNNRVISGYGHAILRVTDPRFTALVNFGNTYMPDEPIFKIVKQLFDIVPNLLLSRGKAKDPWPNVDAASGSTIYHYGITEYEYYTVLFAVSRALGLSAQAVWYRALNLPLIRPKSVTLEMMKKQLNPNNTTAKSQPKPAAK